MRDLLRFIEKGNGSETRDGKGILSLLTTHLKKIVASYAATISFALANAKSM